MPKSIIPEVTNRCNTCGAELTGSFCSNCGEKKLNPSKDYSIGKFLEQTVDGFTHFDSKFLRSFKALLFKPGFLTSEFIHGRRTRYMKPVQIFIIASVLFYFVYPTNSTFYAAVQDMELGNTLKYDVSKAIDKKIVSDSLSRHAVIKAVNKEAAHKSKAYLFMIIPIWGFIFYLLFFRSVRFIVPHLVFAIHNLSFFIILFLSTLTVLYVFKSNARDTDLIPAMILYFVYLFLAIRKVYDRSIFWSLLKGTFALGSFLMIVIVYRQLITSWVLSSS